MTAYMVVEMTVRNADWLGGYTRHVPTIIRRYGGEYVGVSSSVKRLEGNGPTPQTMAIFVFPSALDIERFMESDDYKPYRAARQANSDSDIFIFDALG